MFKYILPFSAAAGAAKRATSLLTSSLQLAGGKGSNLAKLARAGFAVPPGFIITTDAYRLFVASNQLHSRILDLAKSISSQDLAALEATSTEIRTLFEEGTMPMELMGEIQAAYQTLLSNLPNSTISAPYDVPSPVAVRSSATAEDLPGLAFAGQHETYLNIVGERELLEAVKRCWGSLWTGRALAYRARNHIPPDEVALAAVVQQMVEAEVSGVLFTANPLTGRRDEIVIDASFGLGEAIVSGLVDPDHYAVDPHEWRITKRKVGAKELAIVPRAGGEGGTEQVKRQTSPKQALPDTSIIELAQTAERVEALFGAPQDIEWAWANGRMYLLQSRLITSLYPLPELPKNVSLKDGPRLYINFNSIQGVNDPLTPLGIDALRLVFGGVRELLQIESQPRDFLLDAGGRLFLDFTDVVRDRRLRKLALDFLGHTEPGSQQILRRLIEEGRFAPKVVLTPRRAISLLRGVLPILGSVVAALWRPERVRPRVLARAEQFIAQTHKHAQAAKDLPARLRAMEEDLPRAESVSLTVMPTVLPALAAVPMVDRWLTRWLGEARRTEKPGRALPLMRGLPGNITIEMNLKLWAAAQRIRADAAALEWVSAQPVEVLVEGYRQGELPPTAQEALGGFLEEYGMRGIAEIDLGRPPWREDPTQIVQTLLGYLRLEDPDLAPDLLFQRGAKEAERLAAGYIKRVRKTRFGWLKSRLLIGTIGRMRTLGGLRETPLFYLVQVNDIYRTALLDSARGLVSSGQLERAEDIFYIPLDTLKQFAKGEKVDLKTLASANRTDYERERQRRQMPRILLSTGEAFYEGISVESEAAKHAVGGNVLIGEAVSPGVIEGRAHIILDPQSARLEPGDILVCPSTDPGWTPLFLTAGGLVMEIGGMITHGSVVAREYGIPAVVGVHQATTRLKTGQRIRVDGNQGRVTILDTPSA